MVVVCSEDFPQDEEYENEFQVFPHLALSPFQKWAIKAIHDGDHSLITAHTGSGKTLPAEYAIIRAAQRGKRVIYTAPIKALSNTKLSDLRRKYPEISFGLITGDITDNPEAQVLIMTTEVLPATLCAAAARKGETGRSHAPLSFEMDFEGDLDAVIFDEVHYINDPDRGGVWEQAILLLPPRVQLVMLSATISKPEKFAQWIETAKSAQSMQRAETPKKVYLSSSSQRVVPLTHHVWISSAEKAVSHPASKEMISGLRHTPLVLKGPGTPFQEKLCARISKTTRCLADNRLCLRRAGTLNALMCHLKKHEQLPAICFVFSRRQTECCAREVTCSLHTEDEGEMVAGIKAECRRILATRLSNYHEYLELPEYTQLVAMLERGVAVHHAGILPVFREMIEMLFEKRMIKVLFATETLAVGVNFSTSSVVFTGLHKFDGAVRRPLYPHEYTQMAGRAGRRGIDTEGNVWICADLCKLDSMRPATLQSIMSGTPPSLSSKFKLGLSMVLSLVDAGSATSQQLLSSTMLGSDLKAQGKAALEEAEGLAARAEAALEAKKWILSPDTAISRATEIQGELKQARKRKRGRLLAELEQLKAEHRTLADDLNTLSSIAEAQALAAQKKEEARGPEAVLPSLIQATREMLIDEGFMEPGGCALTTKGRIAQHLREAHPLALAALLSSEDLCGDLSPGQLAAVLSCQCGVAGASDADTQWQALTPRSSSEPVNRAAKKYAALLNHFENAERRYGTMSGECYEQSMLVLEHVLQWSMATNETECKAVLASVTIESGIGVGMFVKALLKICNLASEVTKAAEEVGNLKMKEIATAVPAALLKYVATAQSLYV